MVLNVKKTIYTVRIENNQTISKIERNDNLD